MLVLYQIHNLYNGLVDSSEPQTSVSNLYAYLEFWIFAFSILGPNISDIWDNNPSTTSYNDPSRLF